MNAVKVILPASSVMSCSAIFHQSALKRFSNFFFPWPRALFTKLRIDTSDSYRRLSRRLMYKKTIKMYKKTTEIWQRLRSLTARSVFACDSLFFLVFFFRLNSIDFTIMLTFQTLKISDGFIFGHLFCPKCFTSNVFKDCRTCLGFHIVMFRKFYPVL